MCFPHCALEIRLYIFLLENKYKLEVLVGLEKSEGFAHVEK